jgi:hypothetical protein
MTTEIFPDLLAPFQKKESSKSSNAVQNGPPTKLDTTITAPKMKRKKLDPWEWHRKLKDQEAKRQMQVETQIQQNTIQYLAVKQLVADAMKETSSASRWTQSMTKIQDQFAQALVLKETIEGDEENEKINQPEQYNAPMENETSSEELPEKLRKENDEDDEETVNSIAGSWVEAAVHEVAVVVTQPAVSAPPKKTLGLLKGGGGNTPNRCNDGSQPPVFAISFPNPKVSMEAYFILYKQHELLQQTFSRNGVGTMSIEKIQQMKELCLENDTKLQELAGTILQDWKCKEEAIQKLWSTYIIYLLYILNARHCLHICFVE